MDAASTFSATTSAAVVATGGSVVLQCSTSAFYVGGSGVTTANGIMVPQDTPFAIDLQPDESLYCVASGSITVRVLRSA